MIRAKAPSQKEHPQMQSKPHKSDQTDRPHTELRRQDQPPASPDEPVHTGSAKLKPRVADDRVPGGDEDDLFNDMPV